MKYYYNYSKDRDVLFRLTENDKNGITCIKISPIKFKPLKFYILIRCYLKYILYKNFNDYLTVI